MPRNGKDENTGVRLFGYTAAHDSIQSQHVDRDHLVAFLLNGTPFEPVPRKETRKPFSGFRRTATGARMLGCGDGLVGRDAAACDGRREPVRYDDRRLGGPRIRSGTARTGRRFV